jgi:hypothetical protein
MAFSDTKWYLLALKAALFQQPAKTAALMMGMDDTIIDRITFGGVKELEELYQQ